MEDINNNIKIILKAIEAKDLIAGDLNGFSDPYFMIPNGQDGVIDLPKKANRTKRINKTLNPVWNESFLIELNPIKCTKLKIEVYDYDFVGKDDFLGEGYVDFDWLENSGENINEEWIPLKIEKLNKKTKQNEVTQKGSVHVMVRVLGFVNSTGKPFEIIDELPNSIVKSFYLHKTGDPLKLDSWIIISEPEVCIGLGWDSSTKDKLELDASLAAFNSKLNPLDCVYYMNFEMFDEGIKHYGEKGSFGDKQAIKICFGKIPEDVNYLAVTLHSESGNLMGNAKNIYLRLFTKKEKIGKYLLNEKKDCDGLLLGIFQKDIKLNNWYFRMIVEPFKIDKLFYKTVGNIQLLIAKHTLNQKLKLIPKDNKKEENEKEENEDKIKKEKLRSLCGDTFNIKNWIKIENKLIYISIGWDFDIMEEITIITSIFCFDNKNNLLEKIDDDNNLEDENGNIIIYEYMDEIPHIIDDSKILSIDFTKIKNEVSSIAITINCLEGYSLNSIYEGYIRLFKKDKPIGMFMQNNFPKCNGIVLGLFKKNDKDWFFEGLQETISTYDEKNTIKDIVDLIKINPIEINKFEII